MRTKDVCTPFSKLEPPVKSWNGTGMETEGTERQSTPEQSAVEQEREIWTARPSQLINFGLYAVCLLVFGFLVSAFFLIPHPSLYMLIGLGAIMAIFLIVALSRWIITRARVYRVTSQRIKITEGVFSRRTEEVELYRVRDYRLSEPFWMRLFGRGNIVISTTDNSSPTVVLEAIRDPSGHREEIRKYVELCRDKKRVRITEMES